MGASSSCCFCIVKAEESPCTENDRVADSEMVGAEGASTSGKPEYYSARCEAMMRSRDQFSDKVALEIEFSKSHWSEVSRLEVAPQSAEEKELNRENRKLMKQLSEEYPSLFGFNPEGFVLGRMIAKGGQAEIYEVLNNSFYLMKVLERGTSLQDLRRSWPLPVLNEDVRQCIHGACMLEDGRFAFLMRRCWGDLRKLIDQAMQEKNVDGIQGPPFPYNGWEEAHGWNLHPVDFMLDFMLGIATHMWDLHESGIFHRDLKASNILLRNNFDVYHHLEILKNHDLNYFQPRYLQILQGIVVSDFECSIGVLGTGFWRAPEILLSLGSPETITNEQWKKADVYSYGMTCFEIVTGRIPFDGELRNTKADRQLVIEGKRPQLPGDLDEEVKDLITKCWAPNPRLRPTFVEIFYMVKRIFDRQCYFRLFRIGEKLPPHYSLATVKEVNDYPIAVEKAMPTSMIAELANGFVKGGDYRMYTRLEKDYKVGHKLARLHH